MKRGQSALEFVVLASVMFLFFITTTVYVEKTIADFSYSGKITAAQEVVHATQKEIELADQMPTGYSRTFVLPQSVQGIPYSLTAETDTEPLADALVISYSGLTDVTYIRNNITGMLQPGSNTIRKENTILLNVPVLSAANLISNPSFEVDAAGWSTTGSVTALRTPATAVYDNYSVLATFGSGGGSWRYSLGGLNKDTTYLVSGWFKTQNNTCELVAFRNGGGGGNTGSVQIPNTNGGWQYVTLTYYSGNSGGSPNGYVDAPNCIGGETVSVDGVQIVQVS